MKKALIITYYWPPTGGNGVQRWVKFVKYLREFGWEPVVYTVENPEAPVTDNSLLKDIPENVAVFKQPIWEPYKLYKRFTGKKMDEGISREVIGTDRNRTLPERIALWVRGHIFIPDARKFWIRPSVKFLYRYVQSNKVDAVISTGPPHTNHLIALGLKQKAGLKWLADFRDPWTTMDYFRDLRLSRRALARHHRLELEVLRTADRVISVGSMMKKEFDGKTGKNTLVVTNGFDTSDFETGDVALSRNFTLLHMGSLHERRNPETLWKVLKEIADELPDFKTKLNIRLVGKTDHTAEASLEKNGLKNFTAIIPYMDHQLVAAELRKAQLLLLPIDRFEGSQWVLTGKIFEYLASGRPILCIGPANGDAAKLLEETGTGSTCDYDDAKQMKTKLLEFFELYNLGKLEVEPRNVEKYSRRELTHTLATVLDEMIE